MRRAASHEAGLGFSSHQSSPLGGVLPCLSIYLSACLPVCLSVRPSVCVPPPAQPAAPNLARFPPLPSHYLPHSLHITPFTAPTHLTTPLPSFLPTPLTHSPHSLPSRALRVGAGLRSQQVRRLRQGQHGRKQMYPGPGE